MKTIVLNPCSSQTIQKKLDAVKNSPVTYHFNAGEYSIETPIRLYSHTTIECDPETELTLMENAPIRLFDVQTPVFGQKVTPITDLNISGLIYRGNYENQDNTSGDHGLGYGNIFGFSSVSDSNFFEMDLGESEGDIFRIKNGKGLKLWKINSEKGGHDFLHLHLCENVELCLCDIKTRTNNGVRIRGSRNISVHDNEIDGSVDNTYAPGIQLENFESQSVTKNINIVNNYIHDMLGAGIWGLGGDKTTKTDEIIIEGNLIESCGGMPAKNKISGVGGIVFNGYTGLKIIENEIRDCLGYGVLFGNYLGNCNLNNLKASVIGNLISGTKKSLYKGIASGAGTANLLGNRYSITCKDNELEGNVINYYKVKNQTPNIRGLNVS